MAETRPNARPSAARLLTVPPARFLMIEPVLGSSSPDFEEAMSALFTLAYQVKFAAAKRLGFRYKVAPAELLHPESAYPEYPFPPADRSAWRLMLGLPAEIDGEFVDQVRESTRDKRELPAVEYVRVQTFSEGECVEIWTGRGDDRAAALEQLARFVAEKHLEIRGPLHEIFMSDPFRTAPDRLKTVLRYPVRRRPLIQAEAAVGKEANGRTCSPCRHRSRRR